MNVSLFDVFQRQDARIIVGLFYEDMARRVFCEVREWTGKIWKSIADHRNIGHYR